MFSLLVALTSYSFAAGILRENFNLPHSVANALGFLATAGVGEAILGFVFFRLIKKIPYKLWKKPWSRFLAIIPSLGQ